MSERLAGKVAVITGAGSGMGRAAAVMFAEAGARVVCADMSGAEEETAALIGAAAVPAHIDVSLDADVQRMIALAEDHFGKLDVLFNNAGVSGKRMPITEQDEAALDLCYAVNVKGVFLGMKYGIAAMLRAGGGSVINTASASALVGWKGHAAYAASKGAVVSMTQAAALDFATKGIRVNAICPGMTWTGMVPFRNGNDAPPEGTPAPPQPMQRWGLPGELAAAALFLASDESSFITGVALPVDGGYVCP
jgi:NAD(P)-dependent dehydrogenase (short-subunit alcohol dehydrogenase family)